MMVVDPFNFCHKLWLVWGVGLDNLSGWSALPRFELVRGARQPVRIEGPARLLTRLQFIRGMDNLSG
jgi:hypothetical protein